MPIGRDKGFGAGRLFCCDDGYLQEYRAIKLPIITYENGVVTEIKAFHEVEHVASEADVFLANQD